MSVKPAVDEVLAVLLERHYHAIIEHGTDWVVHNAVDLRGTRPREETRTLVAAVVEWSKELMLGMPAGSKRRDEFIEFVTTYRAAHEFSVSTLLRGFLSFRMGLLRVLADESVALEMTFSIIDRVDQLYFASIFKMSDVYVSKLRARIEERQRKVRERKNEVERLERQLAESQLKRYIEPGVVDAIIKGERSLDRKPQPMFATMLFADLAGFTRMTERLPPEQMAHLLDEYLRLMSDVVFYHQGTVDKFMGDGIMVLFGAPLAMDPEEQVMQSVRCAVNMQRALGDLDDRPELRGLSPLTMRIGIDCGNVLVGSFGGKHRADFTAVGLHVNRAHRVETVCKPGEVFVTAEVASRLPVGWAEPAGTYRVKGLGGTVSCFRVVQERIMV